MTVRELLAFNAKTLCGDNADFDSRQIAMFVLGHDLTWLITHSGDTVSGAAINQCAKLVRRVNGGEPLYYVIGKTEFYSLPFYVGRGVLIPRQDTETLVDEALRLAKNMRDEFALRGADFDNRCIRVLDLCAGSGCVGIAIAKNVQNVKVDAVELYDDAYDYLLRNIKLNGCENVTPIKADALKFSGEYDIVVSNPPYVRFDERDSLSKQVLSEPESALFAEDNGLSFYKKITENMKNHCIALAFETGETQGREVYDIMQSCGFHHINKFKDLCGNDRVVSGFSQKYTVK